MPSWLSARLLMRLDAAGDAALALFLLSSSWDALYEALGLPPPKPAFYAQLLGVALVALAVVEWRLAGRPGQRDLALALAIGSALAAAVIVVWLAAGKVVAETHGKVNLWLLATFLALAAVLHARVATASDARR